MRAPSFAPVVELDAVSPEWLSAVLRAAGLLDHGFVTAVHRAPLGTGQTADSYRFTLQYGDDAAGPSHIVGKFPSADPTSARLGTIGGLYRGELGFYRELASDIPVRVPAVVHAAMGETPAEFVLLLEDLSPVRTVDQLTGCTADEAALAVEQAAALHSRTWGRADLRDTPWLRSMVDAFIRVAGRLPRLAERYRTTFAGVIDEGDMAAACRILDHIDSFQRLLDEDRRCVWHQDFRADNLLFDAHAGAVPVAVVDWQTVSYGPGLADLSLFLGGSLTTEDRRRHERDLVRHYHERLVAGGVEGYGYEACWDDYRLMATQPVFTAINGSVQVGRTERGDRMWRVWTERHVTQALDLGSFELLAQR